MDFGLQNIQDYSKDLLWMLKALKQIEKEFYNEKWTFRKPINSESAFNDVVIQLKPKLKELILQRDDGYYKQLLYKIDISGHEDVGSMSKEEFQERKNKATFIDRDNYLLLDLLSAV